MRPGGRVPRFDPISPLLAANHFALSWAVRYDILDGEQDPKPLWNARRVLLAERWQNPDGSWTYHGGSERLRGQEDYAQLATYQQLLTLVSLYRLDRRHPMLQRAAGFLFAHQKPGGDIRGIYGTQYAPNYSADMFRLLIEAGFDGDPHVVRGLEWLLSMRQEDGGWAIPARTAGTMTLIQAMRLSRPLEPDRSKPSSHLITGIVLRAMAAHPLFRHRPEVLRAAQLLGSRFFTADAYLDRKDAGYWTKLAFPFRWNDVVSALDSMALVGIDRDQADVARGLDWLLQDQLASGLWRSGYTKSPDPLADHWVSFAATRVLRRFYGVERLRLPTTAPDRPAIAV